MAVASVALEVMVVAPLHLVGGYLGLVVLDMGDGGLLEILGLLLLLLYQDLFMSFELLVRHLAFVAE